MAGLKNFMETEHMENPEERRAEELKRSTARYDEKAKLRETSVSAQRYNSTMRALGIIIGIIVALLAALLIYKGITLFIPQDR